MPGLARRATIAAAAALVAGSCFLGLTRGLWTPDEPREAGIGREMYLHPGLVPTLDGAPFYEKPPLYYWATAIAFRLAGGPSAPAGRAVSALAGLAVLAVLFCWLRRAHGGAAAAVAAVVLASSVEFVISVHWLRIDALLMLFCAVAVWSAWERIGSAGGPAFLALFYASLVLALWTKGFVGPVIVVTGLAAYAVLARDRHALARLHPLAGAGLLAAAAASLGLAILRSGGPEALYGWAWVNHVQRFVHPQSTGHEQPFYYYATALPLAVLPWLVPFVDLFRPRSAFWRAGAPDAALKRYALATTAGPLLILSAASTKRDVYLLPLMPPLAALMALAVVDRFAPPGRSTGGIWARTGAWIQAGILSAVALAPPVAAIAVDGSAGPRVLILLALALASAAALCIAVSRNDPRAAFARGGAAVAVAIAGLFAIVVPRVDVEKNLAPYLAAVDAALPAGDPVYAVGADETLLGIVPFVTGRSVVALAAADVQKPEGDPPAPPRFVVLQSKRHEPTPAGLEPAYEQVSARGFGPDRRLSLWRRKSDPASEPSR